VSEIPLEGITHRWPGVPGIVQVADRDRQLEVRVSAAGWEKLHDDLPHACQYWCKKGSIPLDPETQAQ